MRIAIIAVSALAFTAPLAAQVCEPGWQPGFGWDPPSQASHAIVTAAPLGREIVFVGGEFTSSVLGEPLSRIASYDGERWDDLQGGVDGTVRAVVAWDPDGPGPARELVVVAGDFTGAGLGAPGGPITAAGVAAWDGRAWQALGDGLAGIPGELAVIDIDGDGASELFAAAAEGGDGIVRRFDGSAWVEVRRWSGGSALTLEPWDRDGAGPEPARLVVATGTSVSAWDGVSWEELPATDNPITALSALPRDAGGTLDPTLFAITLRFRTSWLGAIVGGEWRLLRQMTDWAPVQALVRLDPDGPGPELEGLYFNTYRTLTFNGLISMLTRYPGFTDRVYTLRYPSFEPDIVSDIAAWLRQPEKPPEFWLARQTSDSPWQPGSVSMLSNEPDRLGLGLGPFVTFEHGVVSLADLPSHRLIGRNDRSLSRYDGEVWRSWAGANNTIGDIVTEDERRLYVGGWFSELDGESIRGVGVYEDGEWRQLGDGLGSVSALALADLGGGRQLYAAGSRISSAEEPGIAEWDGARWTTHATTAGFPGAMAAHDPDGAGPEPAELLVGGRFEAIGGVQAVNVAAFDGTSWRPIGDGLSGIVTQLVSHDDDGAGPEPAIPYAMIAGGQIWRFTDGAWEQVGRPDDRFEAIVSFDPDGHGPQPALLLAAGWVAGSAQVRLARLENDTWVSHGGDIHSWCEGSFACMPPAISAITVLREGARARALAMTGAFLQVDDQPSAGIALWIGACPCAADCDGDGDLTFLDFLCFQNRFAAGDPAADCDGDGEFTFFDFLCFQNAFAAGCD